MKLEKISKFGEFEFHKGFVIGRIYEGVNVEEKHIKSLSDLISKYYSGDPIVYISDRVYSYSIDTVATKSLIVDNNICYAAIVTHSNTQKITFPMEKEIIDNVIMKSFHSLDSAIDWAVEKTLELAR